MERRDIERTHCPKRLPEHRQMIDRVLLVDILTYSLVIPATNQCKFTLDHNKPFSLFHKVKHSNVNTTVLCAFTITFTKCNETQLQNKQILDAVLAKMLWFLHVRILIRLFFYFRFTNNAALKQFLQTPADQAETKCVKNEKNVIMIMNSRFGVNHPLLTTQPPEPVWLVFTWW